MTKKQFYIYILANKSRTLYVGVTSDLLRRVYEHKHKLIDGFTSKYNVDRLVYFEECGDAISAIEREKQIKSWIRAKKISMIENVNATWNDLSDSWYEQQIPRRSSSE
ncbi:GIY-YIG nuclease family protein [bacterium]|nr:GIY-YIG nuclease family protein [bacterium]